MNAGGITTNQVPVDPDPSAWATPSHAADDSGARFDGPFLAPALSDDAELIADLPCILAELNRVKVTFQLRAISAVLGLPTSDLIAPVHSEGVSRG